MGALISPKQKGAKVYSRKSDEDVSYCTKDTKLTKYTAYTASTHTLGEGRAPPLPTMAPSVRAPATIT
jgi:hypothetical protein